MELWIRSQEKETLCKVDDIHIEEQSLYTDTHLKISLGTYKTKERALEVLDEIQDRLINLQNYGEITGNCRYEPPCIYKMPEE